MLGGERDSLEEKLFVEERLFLEDSIPIQETIHGRGGAGGGRGERKRDSQHQRLPLVTKKVDFAKKKRLQIIVFFLL